MDILFFVLAVIVTIFLLKILFKISISLIGILVNSIIGAVVLYVLNLIGFNLPINWFTSIIVGALGVPGVVLLVILKLVFKIF